MAEVRHGDCLTLMRALAAHSIDAIVTDPPYALTAGKKGGSGAASVNLDNPYGRARIGTGNGGGGFMGKAWDSAIPGPEIWAEALRVAKPGTHLAAFGGTRTFHRLTCAIEDAGWEIRDCLCWLYGSGFPKSLDVSKAMDRAAGADREPDDYEPNGKNGVYGDGMGGGQDAERSEFTADRNQLGRWPANVALDEAAAALLDEQTGERPGMAKQVLRRGATTGRGIGFGSNATGCEVNAGYGDFGGASRFFYCAKASRSEREEGTYGLPERSGADAVEREEGSTGLSNPRAGAGRTASTVRNHHPTVKPVDLMRWLCRLLTLPGGLVLDPFTGSGSTGVAALLEGFRFLGMEQDEEYVAIARRRIAHAGLQPSLFAAP